MTYAESVWLFDRGTGTLVEQRVSVAAAAAGQEIRFEHPTDPGRAYCHRYTVDEALAVATALTEAVAAAGQTG